MIPCSLLRIGSFGLLSLVLAFCPVGSFSSICGSVAFSHYLMGLIYSRRKIRNGFVRAPLLLLLSATASLVITREGFPSWAAYGIFHYLMSELMISSQPLKELRGFGMSVANRFLLHTTAAVLIFGRDLGISGDQMAAATPAIIATLIFSSALQVLWSLRTTRRLGKWIGLDLICFDILSPILVVYSRFYYLGFEQVSLVHFFFWAAFPLVSGRQKGAGPKLRYLGLTSIMFIGAFVFSPFAAFSFSLSLGHFYRIWSFLSNFHITLSFLMSGDRFLMQRVSRPVVEAQSQAA